MMNASGRSSGGATDALEGHVTGLPTSKTTSVGALFVLAGGSLIHSSGRGEALTSG